MNRFRLPLLAAALCAVLAACVTTGGLDAVKRVSSDAARVSKRVSETSKSADKVGTYTGKAQAYSGKADSYLATAGEVAALAKSVLRSSEDVTPEQEYWLSRSVAAALLSRYRVWEDPTANEYVNLLGQTLAQASDRPETFGGYHFLILDSAEINAMAAPGGHIFITKGLLRCCTTEDALAAVLAHEIAHVANRHGVKAIKTSRLSSAAMSVALYSAEYLGGEELAAVTDLFEESVADVLETLLTSGYSQLQEREADADAVDVLARTGYNPRALMDVLDTMSVRLVGGAHDFAATHPSPEQRMVLLEKKVAPYPEVKAPTVREARFHNAFREL